MVDTQQSPLKPGLDAHVFLVRAEASPLKGLSLAMGASDDLRSCWYPGPYGYRGMTEGVYLEENDYYLSKVELLHEGSGQRLPAGTPFVLVDVQDSDYVSDGSSIQYFEDLVTGKRVVLEAIDPRDSDKRLAFRYWSYDEPARSRFEKVKNQMAIVAIAATGL